MLHFWLLTLSVVGTAAFGSPAALSPAMRPALRAASARPLMMAAPAEEEIVDEEEFITEEEYEAELEAELSQEAQSVVNNMKSESGVEFAPWMKVDAEKIAKAKADREARRARAAAENDGKSDSMLVDPQAAELGAGGGLKSKTLSEEEVELRWSTQDEVGNVGFIVQRRKGGTPDFEGIQSYETFAPLRTKGVEGGDYVYLDDTASPGTWVYRILDCDANGQRSAVCQKLVEIDSNDEQTQTLVVGGFIALLAVVGVVAGIFADPIQTTDMGSKMF